MAGTRGIHGLGVSWELGLKGGRRADCAETWASKPRAFGTGMWSGASACGFGWRDGTGTGTGTGTVYYADLGVAGVGIRPKPSMKVHTSEGSLTRIWLVSG
jgi:hypothetical protein